MQGWSTYPLVSGPVLAHTARVSLSFFLLTAIKWHVTDHRLGKIMNRDYRLTARAHNLVIDTNHGDDLTGFPIEKARFRSIWYSICATGISTAGYGWSIQSRTVSNLPSFVKKTSTIDAHGPINHIAYSCSPRSTIYHRFRYSDHFQCKCPPFHLCLFS